MIINRQLNKSQLSSMRRFAKASAIVLGSFVIAACSSKSPPPTASTPPPPRPVIQQSPTPSVEAPRSASQAAGPAPTVAAPTPAATPAATQTSGPAAVMSVNTGLYRCESGERVTIKRIAPARDNLTLSWKNKDYTLKSVPSPSGALRFEDSASGLVWLAIVGKSQLLNSRLGQRLANECNL